MCISDYCESTHARLELVNVALLIDDFTKLCRMCAECNECELSARKVKL